MSEELRPCPFCGAMPMGEDDRYMCSTLGCVMQEDTISAKDWNTRPIEDNLIARIVELEAENEKIRHLLEEFAMSIYPHGKTPVWNSVSDGVKDLIDYAKSLDDTERRRTPLTTKIGEHLFIGDLVKECGSNGANGILEWNEFYRQYVLRSDDGYRTCHAIGKYPLERVEKLTDYTVDTSQVECRPKHRVNAKGW